MSDPTALRNRLWFVTALALTGLKLWLTRGQGVFAIGNAGYDDRLFLELAHHLVRGEWLGPYNGLTLAKGPFYSLFIAAAFTLGLPLFLAQQLFYAAACALFTRALRPAVTWPGLQAAIYALLLWNPMTYDASNMGRVLRQHVYGPLGLMIFAGLVALYLRRAAPARARLPWVILLGLAAGAFHLTREEGLWLAPAVLLLAGACLYGAWKISRAAARQAAGGLGLAVMVACLPVLFVCAQNQRHYGWFGTCEFRAAAFMDAYGAMLRVNVGPELPYVPVTREARAAMAAVSPAFAAVQAELANGIARGWAGASESFTGLPAAQEQIGGGWMIWAFREAAAKAGPHANARQALAHYRRIADEINRACADGRLPAGAARSGFLPVWRPAQTGPFLQATGDFADFVVRFSSFSAWSQASVGSPEERVLFRDLTRERLSPAEGELDVVGAAQYLQNNGKVTALHQIGKAWRPVLLGLFVLAQIIAGLRTVLLVARRQWSFPLTVAAAAWGSCAASVLMHAMIQATSFPVRAISSFAPVYPLLLVFIVAVFWDAWEGWVRRPLSIAVPDTELARPAPPAGPPGPGTITTLTWIAGLAALLPFVIWRRHFAELFWFADDFFLVDQISKMGLGRWIGVVFAENFVPVFKLFWGGALVAFDGSYHAMLWLLWLNHALNAVLFGRLLVRAGFPWLAVIVAQLIFGLAPANLETLGWSVQWSAVLATTFLLLALLWHEQRPASDAGWNWRVHGPLLLLIAASACSFSRGVLTGPVLALAMLWPLTVWKRQLPVAILCVLPAVAVALIIMFASPGNHRAMAGHWVDALVFGLGYFLLNPGCLLIGSTDLGPARMVLLAGAKLALIAWALRASSGRVRVLLVLLLAYDLGNAALLGVGRHHTGFISATASRYNYSSLLATLPCLGLLLAALLDRGVTRTALRPLAAGLLLAALAWHNLRGWPAELALFAGWRGTDIRRMIAAPATSDPAATVPALDFMHVERAKALTRAYNLH